MLILRNLNMLSVALSVALSMLAQKSYAFDVGSKMDKDFSMRLYEGLNTELATREIALTLGEMVFKEIYGVDEFNMQIPLSIKDKGDYWLIEGNPKTKVYTPESGEIIKGKFVIAIRKSNCEIIKLTQEVHTNPK